MSTAALAPPDDLATHAPDSPDVHLHEPHGFIRRYVFSTDHKVIGIQYIVTGLVMALLGAGLAALIRLQLGWPDHQWPLLARLLPAGYAMSTLWHREGAPSESPDNTPVCPKCGEYRLVERIGAQWFCQVCATAWPARNERRLLVSLKQRMPR